MEFYRPLMVGRVIFTVVSIGLFPLQIIAFKRTSYTAWMCANCLLFWAVGKALSSWIIGPWYIRWYMADVFFVPGFAFGIATMFDGPFFIKNPLRKILLKSIFLSWVAAIMVEMFQLSLGDMANAKGKASNYGGDINDLMIFTIVFLVCEIPLLFSKREVLP